MLKSLKRMLSLTVGLGLVAASGPVVGQQISLNFSENTANQGFAGGQLIGPLRTDSANWNNTNDYGGALPAGTMTNLVDLNGVDTGASVTWSSSTVWYNADGTGDDEHRMSVGYLDDGAPGLSVTFSNVPYANYQVYGLLGSDQGGTTNYTTLDFTVNGVDVFGAANTAPAYNTINESMAQTGSFWSLADGTNRGNYWTIDSTGSTLTITGLPRNDVERGSLSAVIIRDLSVPLEIEELVINRDSGNISLQKSGVIPFGIRGYSLTSAAGSFDQSAWTSVSDNYDATSAGGPGPLDTDDDWTELTAAGVSTDLSEFNFDTASGSPGQLTASISPLSLGNAWRRTPYQDVVATVTQADGTKIELPVRYTGTAIPFGDFTGDGLITTADWPTVRDNFQANLSPTLTSAQSYAFGDLDGDGDNDIRDTLAFKRAFDAANGAGAFVAMAGAVVPEPSTLALLSLGVASVLVIRSRRSLTVGLALAFSALAPSLAVAESVGFNFIGGRPDGGGTLAANDLAGAFIQPNWSNGDLNNGSATNVLNDLGAATTIDVTWTSANEWSAGGAPITSDERLMTGWLDDGGAGARVQVRQVPYANYDLYVYTNSDTGNGGLFGGVEVQSTAQATVRPRVFNGGWVNPDTATGGFFKGEYIRIPETATTTTLGSPPDGNYVVFEDLNLADFDIFGAHLNPAPGGGDSRGAIAGFQIVPAGAVDYRLILEVNTATGAASIKKNAALDSIDFDIDYYQITSGDGSLVTGSWNRLETPAGNPAGFPSGTGTGNGWEVLGTPSASSVAEFYLGDGSGPLADSSLVLSGSPVSLGNLFNPAGDENQLTFEYHLAANDQLVTGRIEFSSSPGQPGDHNGDGKVDAADYVMWRDNPPSSGGNPGGYSTWRQNFGGQSPGAGGSTNVPEPSAGVLMMLSSLLLLPYASRRRIRLVPRAVAAILAAVAIFSVVNLATVEATITYDRLYETGDPGSGDATFGATVVEGGAVGFDFNGVQVTADEIGPTGAYIDARVNNGPTYTGVANRPGAGGNDFGIRFDGIDDFLGHPISLNAPTQMWDNTTFFPANLHAVNYEGIFSHGIATWVKPDVPALSDPLIGRQDVIIDTQDHGIFVSDDGNWGLLFDKESINTGVSVASTLNNDGWAHVMELSGYDSPVDGNSAFGGALLVNGVAVAARDRFYDPSAQAFSVGANQDGSGNFYKGVLDNPGLFLWGDNTETAPGPQGQAGMNFGTLNLGTDNDWIAQELDSLNVTNVADVNLDGSLTSADVTAFVGHWLKERNVDGVLVGDWISRQNGDLNYSGITDLDDAVILHDALLSAGLGGLDFGLLGTAVPEPTSVVLVGLALFGLGCLSRRRR